MNHWIKNSILMVLMIGASAIATVIKPTEKHAPAAAGINLQAMIPRNFAGWNVDDRVVPIMPAPEVTELVNRIYDETLVRTYVNENGDSIMLSIAYGGDQTGRLRVHRPESCYSGQGFFVKNAGESQIRTPTAEISAKRLTAQSGSRHEPITYWIRIGDSTVTSMLGQRITQLRFGLTGEVPDGLIFRVSSISDDDAQAYALHDRFINDLMHALPAKDQITLVGAIAADSQHGTEPAAR